MTLVAYGLIRAPTVVGASRLRVKRVAQEDIATKCSGLWYRMENKLCQVEDMMTTCRDTNKSCIT